MSTAKSRGKIKVEVTGKRQVKLMLPLTLHQELSLEARQQGLSLATYIRMLIYQNRLPRVQKNAKISQEDDSPTPPATLQRVRDVFV